MCRGCAADAKDDDYIALFTARDSNNTANRKDVAVYLSLTPPYAKATSVRRVTEFCEQVQLPSGLRMHQFTCVGPAP